MKRGAMDIRTLGKKLKRLLRNEELSIMKDALTAHMVARKKITIRMLNLKD
jgi:hypothetical protein